MSTKNIPIELLFDGSSGPHLIKCRIRLFRYKSASLNFGGKFYKRNVPEGSETSVWEEGRDREVDGKKDDQTDKI